MNNPFTPGTAEYKAYERLDTPEEEYELDASERLTIEEINERMQAYKSIRED